MLQKSTRPDNVWLGRAEPWMCNVEEFHCPHRGRQARVLLGLTARGIGVSTPHSILLCEVTDQRPKRCPRHGQRTAEHSLGWNVPHNFQLCSGGGLVSSTCVCVACRETKRGSAHPSTTMKPKGGVRHGYGMRAEKSDSSFICLSL